MKKQLLIFVLMMLPFLSFGQTKIDYSSINDSCVIYVPNIVSANCENLYYDYKFRIISNCGFSEYELVIYNRWGEVQFISNDPAKFWGAVKEPDGVYIWKIKGTFLSGEKIDSVGHVTVLK